MRPLLIVVLAATGLSACNTWKGAGDDLSAGYHGTAEDETAAQKLERESRSEAGRGGISVPDNNDSL